MATPPDAAPKAYGGDARELLRSPAALVGAAIGCGLTICLAAFLVFQLRGDCIASFEAAWLEHVSAPIYSEAFTDAVLAECGSMEDPRCLHAVRARRLTKGLDVFTLTFELRASEACPAETQNDDAFEIDFEPGALVKLGVEAEGQQQPEQAEVHSAPQANEVVTDTAVAPKRQPRVPEQRPAKPPGWHVPVGVLPEPPRGPTRSMPRAGPTS